jgi:hypothetical protein
MGLAWLPFKPDGPAEENDMASFYQSWWREMGAISRGMMFIEGNLATRSALEDNAQRTQRAKGLIAPPVPFSMTVREQARRAYRNFLLLGGRPISPGHNDDIDEPFPQIEEEEPAPSRRFAPARLRNTHPSQTCATC